jgi:hypothetical protein
LADLGQLLSSTRVQKFDYAEKMAKDKESHAPDAAGVAVLLARCAAACQRRENFHCQHRPKRNDNMLANRLGLGRARHVVHDLELALKRLERNVNPRLLAEVLLLDLPET